MSQSTIPLRKSPAVLLILDGFGCRESAPDNAISQAHMPYWDELWNHYAHGTIDASEGMVGLPQGQFGNSEVGHLNLGAGRVLLQDLMRINESIRLGTLKDNEVLQEVSSRQERPVHLLGLLSDGGVHSHIDHIFAVLEVLIQKGVQKIVVHPFLDGRDTLPKSALPYLEKLKEFVAQHPNVKIGVMAGRFYAMDRDNRWERTQQVYEALTETSSNIKSKDVSEVLQQYYDEGISDEFIPPTLIMPDAVMNQGDAAIFLNYRADRARQLFYTFVDPEFKGFDRNHTIQLSYLATMTSYDKRFDCPTLFGPQVVKNTIGEYVSQLGLQQLRIAETEKYPHVTYFFSGGREIPFQGEERILIPSPKVRTYDLQPEMSAPELTAQLIAAIESRRFELIICNFANADMVGHTGSLPAAIQALETLDKCLGQIIPAVLNQGGEALITADHGNCEQMYDNLSDQPHTQHTTNPVPLIYVGQKAAIQPGGALKDIAPTLLFILGLEKPTEMSGENLIVPVVE